MSRLLACITAAVFPAANVLAQTALAPAGNTLLKNSIASETQFGYGIARGDVDNDGIDDLIVAPNGGTSLRVLRGAAWTVGTIGPVIKFSATTFDTGRGFRANTIITGDFDGDGRDEIAFGNPSFSSSVPSGGRAYVARRDNAGAWSVVTTIQQGDNGYPGAHEAGDSFGNALAAGDFDGDGYDDLAVGALGEAVGTVDEAGAVMIEYGTASGITSARGALITRNSDGLTFDPLEGDRFGYALASGDFDSDGYADLAIGATGARCLDGTTKGGAVIVMYGSAGGLATNRSRIFRPGVNGMLGSCSGGTQFGFALRAGQFDGGFSTDLAIGTYAHAVHVAYSSVGGLDTSGNQRFSASNVVGLSASSGFGRELSSGSLRRGAGIVFGQQSLVVGAPDDVANGLDQSGSVTVLHADSNGLKASTAERWTRSAARSIGAGAIDDRYGSALAVGDYNDDGVTDLAISVPYYDDGAQTDDGAVEVLYGSEFIFRDGLQ